MNIEPLEARIAPAAVFTFTDLDGDLVTVSSSKGVNADLAAAGVLVFSDADATHPRHLQVIDFTLNPTAFASTNLTVTAKRGPLGDGHVNVGRVNATGLDLLGVTIPGDLGSIDVGDPSTSSIYALLLLSSQSMGRYGLATQGGTGDLVSDIDGAVRTVKIAHDVKDAYLHVTAAGSGSQGFIRTIEIGGSLIGGAADRSGSIQTSGSIETVKIGGNIEGGAGLGTGSIQSDLRSIKSVTVGGSLLGGAGDSSGQIRSSSVLGAVKIGGNVQGGGGATSGVIASFTGLGADDGGIGSITIGGSLLGGNGFQSGFIRSSGLLKSVTIDGDVRGGPGKASGYISGLGNITSATIGGSVVGGAGPASGGLQATGDVAAVKIGHDLQGGGGIVSGFISSRDLAAVSIGGSLVGGSNKSSGTISGAAIGKIAIGRDLIGGSIADLDPDLEDTGSILATKGIASLTIGGSILAGTDTSTMGDLLDSATIRAGDHIGKLNVYGSIVGHQDTGTGASTVVISARGQAIPTAPTDQALTRIAVRGRVEHAQILAGYDLSLNPVNGNAQIRAVRVSGDWIASDLVAGVQADNVIGMPLDVFGDGDDVIIAGGTISAIRDIQILGTVIGTGGISAGDGDHFGFVSGQIGKFKAGGFTATFTAARDNPIELSLLTGDVTIREVSPPADA